MGVKQEGRGLPKHPWRELGEAAGHPDVPDGSSIGSREPPKELDHPRRSA